MSVENLEIQSSLLGLGHFERIVGDIASQVTLLHNLSNTIRKASRESQNLKAQHFMIKDEDGNDMEKSLRLYFIKALHARFPESSESIRHRLCSTMLIRRKTILHRRHRYYSAPNSLPKPAVEPLPRVSARPSSQQGSSLQKPIEGGGLTARSTVCSTVQSATTLATPEFQQESAPSTVSQARTDALAAHEALVIPPAPKPRTQNAVETTCPFCLISIPVRYINNQASWRLVLVAMRSYPG